MMEEAIKSHKENAFSWPREIQDLIARFKARLVRWARQQAIEAARMSKAAPRRYLVPR